MLLVVQAGAIALGALPIFWLGRKHLGSEWAGVLCGLAYLVYPAVQWLALDEFHPVALACPLLAFAFWYLDEDRLWAFVPFGVLAALTKEEIPLVVAALGVWYAIAKGRRLAGTVIAVAGIATTAHLARSGHAALPRGRRAGLLRPLRRRGRLSGGNRQDRPHRPAGDRRRA